MSLSIKESQRLNYGCDSPWHDHHEHQDYWNGLLGNILDPAPVLEIRFGPLTEESKKSKNYVNFNLCDLFKAPSSLVLPKCLWSPDHGRHGVWFQGLGFQLWTGQTHLEDQAGRRRHAGRTQTRNSLLYRLLKRFNEKKKFTLLTEVWIPS